MSKKGYYSGHLSNKLDSEQQMVQNTFIADFQGSIYKYTEN